MSSNGTTYPAPRCGGCGELFAGTLTATGTSPLFDGALRAGARSAGWAQIAGKWKCSVCLAGIAGPTYGPEREPASPLPAPDSDPYRQYADMSAELDADLARFWDGENAEHNAASFRIRTRLHDAQIRISEMAGAA